MSRTKGLDPNSDFMVSYLNCSYSKDSWSRIHEEIQSFADIIEDSSYTTAERIDAEGYNLICKFKIAGHIFGIKDPEARAAEIEALRPVLESNFSLSGAISYEQIVDHIEMSGREIMGKYKEGHTAAAASATNQAASVVMKMFIIGGETRDFDDVAKVHFLSAEECSQLGNARGATFLSTAYEWLQGVPGPDPEVYRRPLQEIIESRMEVAEFAGTIVEFCTDQEFRATQRAAELGYKSAEGSLGKYAKASGDLVEAEEKFKIAADADLSRYQYELGALYVEQGRMEEAIPYLEKARYNGFDVETKLEKRGLDVTLPSIAEPSMGGLSSLLRESEINVSGLKISEASDSAAKATHAAAEERSQSSSREK